MNIIVLFLILFPSAFAMYDDEPNVIELTPSNFDKKVNQNEGIWVVKFYAPWCESSRSLRKTYIELGGVLKGVINVGAIDVDHYKEFGEKYGIFGFPAIVYFGLKKKPEPYKGEPTLENWVEEALRLVKVKINKRAEKIMGRKKRNSEVYELTDENFDGVVLKSDDVWMVEFYAPWCGHCKRLAPEWEKAARALKGKVKLGALDCTVHKSKASEYEISGYPTIKVFPLGAKSRKSPWNYDDSRASDAIVDHALDVLRRSKPPPELQELTQQKAFDKCAEKALCVIGILPHIFDCQSKCRNDYLTTLRKNAEAFKDNFWGWVWASAGSQSKLEEVLEIGGFGYPSLGVLNKRKMKYTQMKGPFSLEGIKEFLRDVSIGKSIRPISLSKEIPSIDLITPWDGKDAKYPKETQEETEGDETEDTQIEKNVAKDEL